VKLTFGKYKGEELHEVPISYLMWLEEQDWVRPDLRKDLQYEIARRTGDVSSLGRVVK